MVVFLVGRRGFIEGQEKTRFADRVSLVRRCRMKGSRTAMIVVLIVIGAAVVAVPPRRTVFFVMAMQRRYGTK